MEQYEYELITKMSLSEIDIYKIQVSKRCSRDVIITDYLLDSKNKINNIIEISLNHLNEALRCSFFYANWEPLDINLYILTMHHFGVKATVHIYTLNYKSNLEKPILIRQLY